MKTTTTEKTAREAYIEQLTGLRERIARLQSMREELVGDGTIKDGVNWGHVNDLAALNEALGRALERTVYPVGSNHPAGR